MSTSLICASVTPGTFSVIACALLSFRSSGMSFFARCTLRANLLLVGIETNPGPSQPITQEPTRPGTPFEGANSSEAVDSFLAAVSRVFSEPIDTILGDDNYSEDITPYHTPVMSRSGSFYNFDNGASVDIHMSDLSGPCSIDTQYVSSDILCCQDSYVLSRLHAGYYGTTVRSIAEVVKHPSASELVGDFITQCEDNCCGPIFYVNFANWVHNLYEVLKADSKSFYEEHSTSPNYRNPYAYISVQNFFKTLYVGGYMTFQSPNDLEAFVSWLRVCRVSATHPPEFLVGIETNPGPCVLSTAKSFGSSVESQMQLPLSIGLNNETQETIGAVIDRLDELLSSGVKVTHGVDSKVFEALKPIADSLAFTDVKTKYFKVSLAIICAILGAYLSYKVGSPLAKMAIKAICSVKKSPEVAEVTETFCNVSAQIGSGDVVTSLLSYLYFQVVSKSWEEGDLQQFIKGCERLGKQKEGLVSFVDHLLLILQKFSDYVSQKWNIPKFQFRSTGDHDIDTLQAEIEALMANLRSTGLYNAANGKIAFDLEARIRKLKASMPKSREFAPQVRSIYDLEMCLKPLIQRFERNNIVGNGPRSEPLGVMLGGPSGVGKSTATVPILLAVMARVLPEEKIKSFMDNHNDFIWNFIPENHFHDAFHGQFCTIIDEAGFVKDSVGVPDAGAMGAIRFINTACMPLTMAHLEDKGNTNFNSEIVFATTNRNFFKWESMYSSEAYVRRFKIAMLAVPKEKYCIKSTITEDPWERRLDLSSLPPGCVLDEDVPEYIPWNFLKGHRGDGPVLDFHQLVDRMVAEYSHVKQKGEALLNAHKILKSKYVEERTAAQMDFGQMDEALNVFSDINFSDFSATSPAGILSACVAIAAGAWYFLRATLGGQSGDVKGKSKAKSVKKVFKARPVSKVTAKAQLGANSGVVAGARKVLKRNMYKLYCQGLEKYSVYGTFIKGRLIMVPAHFFHAVQTFIDDKDCEANPVIVFERCSTEGIGFEVRFEELDASEIKDGDEETDVFFVNVPKVVPCHADIVSMFKLENRDSVKSRFSAMLAKPDGRDLLFMCAEAYPSGAVTYAPFEATSTYRYDLPTRKGDCGSLLFSAAPGSGKATIVGMHVAGNEKNLGYSTQLSFDMIEAAACLDNSITHYVDEDPDIDAQGGVLFSGDIVFEEDVAQIGSNFLVGESVENLPIPSRNSVVKSKLYGKLNTPVCAPSMLRSMDLGAGVKDPWVNARSKYSRYQKALDTNLLEVVSASVSQMILYCKKSNDPWDPRLFTFEEAVAGIPGVPFAEGIPRNTSAGYPFCLGVKSRGKKDWFGDDQEYTFDSEKAVELKNSVLSSISSLEKGFRMRVRYADYLKDERRPIEKVVQGKTRLISASPMDYLIICRMYFGDFVRSVMSGRIINGMAMGVNPYSDEWGFMVRYMKSVGDKCIFGDYSAYDGSLPIAVMYKALDVIEDFYASAGCDPADSVVRAALFEDVVNSRHVCANEGSSFSYEWFGSNPSGNFLTTALNSICNNIIIRYAAVKIVCEADLYKGYLTAAADLPGNLRSITFGDDNGICVSDKWAPYVNQQTFTAVMSSIGMTYTDETKSGSNDLVHRRIEDCTFLKRAFKYVPEDNRWDAPLEVGVVEEMCNWTKRSCTDKDLIATIETALKEAAFHGPAYYSDFSKRLRNATVGVLDYVPTVNYKSALKAVRGLDLNY